MVRLSALLFQGLRNGVFDRTHLRAVIERVFLLAVVSVATLIVHCVFVPDCRVMARGSALRRLF